MWLVKEFRTLSSSFKLDFLICTLLSSKSYSGHWFVLSFESCIKFYLSAEEPSKDPAFLARASKLQLDMTEPTYTISEHDLRTGSRGIATVKNA